MRWSHPTPVREDLILNILGTRVILPTYPDYDMDRLQDFVLEACGTRGFRGCVSSGIFFGYFMSCSMKTLCFRGGGSTRFDSVSHTLP